MSQHAIQYTYDRMKLIFALSLLICELSHNLLNKKKNKLSLKISILLLVIFSCLLNYKSYISDDSYIWEAPQRNTNEKFVKYINDNYDSYILGSNIGVRGYVNMLFEKGIYEFADINNITEIASQKNKDYEILLNFNSDTWNIDTIDNVYIYSIKKDNKYILTLCNDKICISKES